MKNFDHVFSFSEAPQEIKRQYFTGNDETGYSWIYNYIIGGMNHLKEEVPQELSGSIFEDLYKQVGAEQLCCCLFSFLIQKM